MQGQFYRVAAGAVTVRIGQRLLLTTEQVRRHRSRLDILEQVDGGTWCRPNLPCDFQQGETVAMPAGDANPAPGKIRPIDPPAA